MNRLAVGPRVRRTPLRLRVKRAILARISYGSRPTRRATARLRRIMRFMPRGRLIVRTAIVVVVVVGVRIV